MEGKIGLSSTLTLPIVGEMIPSGIGFGTSLLVEFQPDSLWYEASLTIAAHALLDGVGVEYHVFQHDPEEVRETLNRVGLNVKRLEDEDQLRIIDSYTVTTGLSAPQKAKKSRSIVQSQTLKVSDWSIITAKEIKTGFAEADMRRLHIDDNTTVLNRYNSENAIVDYWRTRTVPFSRTLKLVYVHSLVTGVASEAFYRQFESLSDGLIDFKTEEKNGEIQHYVRVRLMRGRPYDSRWRRLVMLENGEVKPAD